MERGRCTGIGGCERAFKAFQLSHVAFCNCQPHKIGFQATNGGPAAGRASANGISLMQKAVMLEEEDKKGKELEARKRQQAGDGSSRLVAGKTTAPEKFRITGKHKQDGGGTQAPFLPGAHP